MNARALPCLLLLAALPAAAADFRFAKAIERPESAQEALLALPLDSEVYAAAAENYADLRIVDPAGAETPYWLEKAVETREEILHVPHAGEVAGMEAKGGGIEILLRAGKDSPPTDGFTVHTPLADYEYQVKVLGSADGREWSPLLENAAIYDYSRHMDIANRDIALPANPYRQFKLIVEQATQIRQAQELDLTRKLQAGQEQERSEYSRLQSVPLRIDRIEFWHKASQTTQAAEKKFAYAVGPFSVETDPAKHWSIISLATRREPLTRLVLHSAQRNFSRRASLQIPQRQGIETRWQGIANATLQSLHFQQLEREQTALDFAEQRQAQYRIVLYNQDDAPLPIDGIEAEGNRYQLLFLAQPGVAYRLQYGAADLAAPQYDTAPLREMLRAYPPLESRLGPEQALTTAAGTFGLGKLLNSTAFLITVIVLVLAVLAWAVLGAGKRIGQLSGE